MTIGEFAGRTGLSISALRFYAGRGLLVPAEIDSSNGYRLYSQAQVSDGRLVRDLRRLDMPLAEIARTLALDERQRKELVSRHLKRLEQVIHRAHVVAQSLGVESTMEETDMAATRLQAMDLAHALDQVFPAAGTDPEIPHLMGVLIEGEERFCSDRRHRQAPSGSPGSGAVRARPRLLRGCSGRLTCSLARASEESLVGRASRRRPRCRSDRQGENHAHGRWL